jgi:hypothetical protein
MALMVRRQKLENEAQQAEENGDANRAEELRKQSREISESAAKILSTDFPPISSRPHDPRSYIAPANTFQFPPSPAHDKPGSLFWGRFLRRTGVSIGKVEESSIWQPPVRGLPPNPKTP